MRKWMGLCALACLVLTPYARADKEKIDDRVRAATDVFGEIMRTPDKGIPQDLLNDAECVIIVPSTVNGGFIFGGRYGRGVATCKTDSRWSPPSMVMLGGGSFGLQIGGQATDLVLLVMNNAGKDFLYRDKVTLGGDVSGSAGPVGRHIQAETNGTMKAKMLAWSRSRGLFGGVTVNGATLRPDNDANRLLYGDDVRARQILEGQVEMPPVAQPLIAEISEKTGVVAQAPPEPAETSAAAPRGLAGKENEEQMNAAIDKRIAELGEYDVKGKTFVHFPVGSANLSPEAKHQLDQLAAEAANEKGYIVQIAGFASKEGTDASNMALSRQRAQAVSDYLAINKKIPPRHLAQYGYGEHNPVARNDTPEGRAENRRAEVVILVNRGLSENAPPADTSSEGGVPQF